MALDWFEKRVWRFLEGFGAKLGEAGVLLAVSGGADSMALLRCFNSFRSEKLLSGVLVCGHVNHSLRGQESDGDEEFVCNQCEQMGIGFFSERVNVKKFASLEKLSIETAARELRRRALAKMADKGGCCVIATAHHANDNAETILHRLSRGTGLRGLSGILAERELDGTSFISPLLCVSRLEIERYLRGNGAVWRCDSTNRDVKHTRNFVRHCLVGAIEETCSEPLVPLLSSLSQRAAKLRKKVEQEADVIWRECVEVENAIATVDAERFSKVSELVGVEIIRRCLVSAGCGERYVTREHYVSCYKLFFENVSGKKLQLPGCEVRREYGSVLFSARCYKAEMPEKSIWRISAPGQTFFGAYVAESQILSSLKAKIDDFRQYKTPFIERLDADKIEGDLWVSGFDEDAGFVPLGMRYSIKVRSFLDARKVAKKKRSELLIVGDSEKVIWLWPIRLSEQVRVDTGSKKIMELEINKVAR